MAKIPLLMNSNARRRYVLSATIGYLLFGVLWIIFSDKLFSPFGDGAARQWVSMAKGLFFVVVTSLLFYAALQAEAALLKSESTYRSFTDNITERKRTELALRKSEASFRQLFSVVPVPLCFANKDGVLVDFNQRFARTFGYSRGEVPNMEAWWRLAYPDPAYRLWVLTTWESAVRRAAEEKADIEPMEYRITCKGGEVRTMVTFRQPCADRLPCLY